MAMIINPVHMDGDNCEVNTTIANPTAAAPDVELHPYTAEAVVSGDWQMAMQSFTGCLGKTPEFTFLVAGASPKLAGSSPTFQQTGRPVINPRFSYDGITWTKFANADDGSNSDLVFSHSSAFTSDLVQISLTDMWTWTRIKAYLNSVWHGHRFIDYTTSGAGSYNVATYPGDTDLESRVIPAMDWVGFKISHPDFRSTFRRKMVIIAGVHCSEHSGNADLVQFVDDLLSASKAANGVQGTDRTNANLAYETLRFCDVYVYPLTNPASYFSDHDSYQGTIVSGYNFGSTWHTPNATVHEPLRDAIETDIDSEAFAAVSFHAHVSPYIIGHFYQKSDIAKRAAYGIASMTRVGSTVTVTTDFNHALNEGEWIFIENSAISDYNGSWKAENPVTTTFTFNIGALTPADDSSSAANVQAVDPNGEDPQWENYYGTTKNWYGDYMREIESGALLTFADNVGAFREYARKTWGSEICMTTESGQWAERSEAEVQSASKAVLHTIVSCIEDGRTSIPRTSANGKIK